MSPGRSINPQDLGASLEHGQLARERVRPPEVVGDAERGVAGLRGREAALPGDGWKCTVLDRKSRRMRGSSEAVPKTVGRNAVGDCPYGIYGRLARQLPANHRSSTHFRQALSVPHLRASSVVRGFRPGIP